VVRRRQLATRNRQVTGIEDEILDLDAFDAERDGPAVQGEGALMVALGAARTGKMRDIVGTIQAEQDRVIRAPLNGVLVVQGAPGTGKTAVALHRAAYLLYSYRDRIATAGVLMVGPNERFLRYIDAVLPALGEADATVLATPGRLYPGIEATGSEEPAIPQQKLYAAATARVARWWGRIDLEHLGERLDAGEATTDEDEVERRLAYLLVGRRGGRVERLLNGSIIATITGREVASVYAVGVNRGDDFFATYDDVDTLTALLTLDDDTLATVSCTRYNAAGYDVRLEVLGSAGSVAVGLDDRTPLRSTEPGVTFPAGSAYPMFPERFAGAYAAELTAFLALARDGGVSPCTPADALEAFYVAEAGELSRRESRLVAISEVRR